ncbi:MAG: DUF4388 domain-containing protein, partial [Chloroflexota bacterium]
MSGSVEAIGLPAIARFLADLHKTGTLRVTYDRWSGEVAFGQGEVVAAAFGRERGRAALDAIALGLRVGEFAFIDGEPTGERNVQMRPDEVLAHLDALLGQHGPPDPTDGAAGILSPAAVPHVVQLERPEDQGEGHGTLALTRSAIQTLLAVDGRRNVAEIAGGRGLAETIHELTTLASQGLVIVSPPATPPARPG